ncbi:hypothetical protein Bp8pC_196 [Bacillus phage Bp8p-C]|uniref:Uncharacterized protein n=2 Tax=Agatevirus Bp8pC TaxID=1910937 RepID=A0A0A0PUX8_9CAUD|nr:hypothetical protein AXJ20_gp152 [Bacillus phage Bp8p-C]YP_009784496.1 hypothetical protein QLX39_gp152 [Bacillus phage Bp8p-T]AHJ87626.1 hypothetical protein Bp8pC_196 [Bacillus phage Bp8p-C]AHJ87837.1 hypothetical protein Bp8pT_196 [Bacillus phage Bp8p-T]
MTNYSIEPEGFLKAYDNEGRTLDRYSVQLIDMEEGTVYTVACSANPFEGVWSFSDDIPLYDDEELHEDIGKEIEWGDLPYNVQKAVYLHAAVAENFHK